MPDDIEPEYPDTMRRLGDALPTQAKVASARAAWERAISTPAGRARYYYDSTAQPATESEQDYQRWARIVGESYAPWRLDNLTHHLIEVVPSLRAWVDQPRWTPLVLAGQSGAGKTAAACAAAYAWRAGKSRPVVFAPVPMLLDALRDTVDEDAAALLARLRRVIDPAVPALVILDDLGALDGTRYFARQLDGFGSLIERIGTTRTRVIVTSNLNRKQRQDFWDQRLYSRIMGGSATIGLQGGDLRGEPAPELPGIGPCPFDCTSGMIELGSLPDGHVLIETQMLLRPDLGYMTDGERFDHFAQIVVRCPHCRPGVSELADLRQRLTTDLDRLEDRYKTEQEGLNF